MLILAWWLCGPYAREKDKWQVGHLKRLMFVSNVVSFADTSRAPEATKTSLTGCQMSLQMLVSLEALTAVCAEGHRRAFDPELGHLVEVSWNDPNNPQLPVLTMGTSGNNTTLTPHCSVTNHTIPARRGNFGRARRHECLP